MCGVSSSNSRSRSKHDRSIHLMMKSILVMTLPQTVTSKLNEMTSRSPSYFDGYITALFRLKRNLPDIHHKNTCFSRKYPATSPHLAIDSEKACRYSTTTNQDTVCLLQVWYCQIQLQKLIHFVNTKRDSVKNQLCIAYGTAKKNQLFIVCGTANIQPVLDKNDNAKFSRFQGSVDISSIISSLYFIGCFK